MSKRDIILFDIGRKTTGFSEKNLRTSSEPAIHSLSSVPSQLYPSASRENKPVIFWVVSYGVVYVSPSCISGGIWRWVWISLYLNENHSHLGGYITGFDSNVKGFFCLFLPYFALFFLDISC